MSSSSPTKGTKESSSRSVKRSSKALNSSGAESRERNTKRVCMESMGDRNLKKKKAGNEKMDSFGYDYQSFENGIDQTSKIQTPSQPSCINKSLDLFTSHRPSFQGDLYENVDSTVKSAPFQILQIIPFDDMTDEAENEEIDFTDSDWSLLKDAIRGIQEQRSITGSLEELYQAVERILKDGEKVTFVYENIGNLVRAHMISQRDKLVSESNSNSSFLTKLDNLWQLHCEQMVMIRSIFLHLDRAFIVDRVDIVSIWYMGLEIFRDITMENQQIRSRCTHEILKLIDNERKSMQVDRLLIKSVLRMLSSLSIYEQVFEGAFLKASQELYRFEGQRLSSELEVIDYLYHVKMRLTEETNRANFYLCQNTKKPLLTLTEKRLIADHVKSLVDRGFADLLRNNNHAHLSLIYALFSRTESALEILRTAFHSFIVDVGSRLVLDTSREKTLISEILAMKKKFDEIIENCFNKNENFKKVERDAFGFINKRSNKPAELIAKYMDSKLRSGSRDASEEQMECLMDELIVIFRFIDGKDVFEAYYKRDLAKRLLYERSASVDAEKSVLTKLKLECGPNFTHRLEGMFKDMEITKELASSFKTYIEHADRKSTLPLDIDFSATVLTIANWPPYPQIDLIVPPTILKYQNVFEEHYVSKHSGHKLCWQHSLGQVILRLRANSATKEFIVSPFQAIILLLYNNKDEWEYEEIAEAVGTRGKELDNILQSLVCTKIKILLKDSQGAELNDTQGAELKGVYCFNENFEHKLFRIKINQFLFKETAEEQVKTENEILMDRQHRIDAAAVRIMKMRKKMQHSALVTELVKQLKFPVKSSELKLRIETLIDRDYMCRDKDDSTVYNYI